MAMNSAAIAKTTTKEKAVSRWMNLRNKLARGQAVVEESLEKVGTTAATYGSFAALFYLHERRRLKGKRNTFDKAGKFNAYFWPGLAAAVIGVTPLAGKAGRYLAGAGVGAMAVGSVPAIQKLAAEHHASSGK